MIAFMDMRAAVGFVDAETAEASKGFLLSEWIAMRVTHQKDSADENGIFSIQ